mmetsp:Transcript_17549/g.19564  ORF Transcript_17549/g.19564 Transcript_17549/m.19564 type:complete len:269 (-) Transcript_17549:1795-2601(-)
MSKESLFSRLMFGKSSRSTGKNPIMRLFFVRHGETEANRDKIAAGRMHSPLTENGIRQAKALGVALENLAFQRYVTSDMERARKTAQLVSPSSAFSLESRLREMGKGAREGYPKVMMHEDATRMRNLEGKTIPLLESDDQVWERVSDWLIELLVDIPTINKGNFMGPHSALVITHAGIIRTVCSRLLSGQMPKAIDTSRVGVNGTGKNHLSIPNCSVTIITISVPREILTLSLEDIERKYQGNTIWDIVTASLDELTLTTNNTVCKEI